jgi:glycosyltransferase involved in cell wall biosynthesis
MASAMLFTVVIPTRNAAANVEACLSSLCMQTSSEYEVVVIDSASTDGTLNKLGNHAVMMDQVLTCVSEPDAGVYDAMNKGIARARGEWLYFLGADDVLHDAEVFSDVAGFIATHRADIVYGDVVMKNSGVRYGGAFSLDRLLFEGNICHQAVFYRRSVFEKVGYYSLRYPIWADWEFNIRCFRNPGIRALWMDRVLAVYRDNFGISRKEDPVFKNELPATLIRQRAALERKLERITSTFWYKLYRSLSRPFR